MLCGYPGILKRHTNEINGMVNRKDLTREPGQHSAVEASGEEDCNPSITWRRFRRYRHTEHSRSQGLLQLVPQLSYRTRLSSQPDVGSGRGNIEDAKTGHLGNQVL